MTAEDLREFINKNHYKWYYYWNYYYLLLKKIAIIHWND